MKQRLLYIYMVFGWITFGLTACGEPNKPEPKQPFASEYHSCYVVQYGQAYDSVPHNVFALDLYSEGLTLDSTKHIVGTGTNLYISDIFLSDSLFATGTYLSDTTAADHTFLPGQTFEGTPTGIYLLMISESSVAGIQVVDSGRFVVNQTADSLYDMCFTLYYGKAKYEGHFVGIPNHDDRR